MEGGTANVSMLTATWRRTSQGRLGARIPKGRLKTGRIWQRYPPDDAHEDAEEMRFHRTFEKANLAQLGNYVAAREGIWPRSSG